MIPINLETISKTLKNGGKYLIKAAPTIGVIFGVGLMGGATVKTGMETPDMKAELEALNEEEGLTHNEYLKKKFWIIARHLGLPTAMALAGAGMIFGGYKIKYTQAAIATAALATQSDEMKKLEDKVIEKYGPKEYKKMRTEMAKDDISRHPINYATIINTGHGNTLCYDPIVHDYYWSDLDFIRKIERVVNDEMRETRKWGTKKSTLTYDQWREYLDLPTCDSTIENNRIREISNVDIGKDLGWFNRYVEIEITVGRLSDDTIYHIIGFTDAGKPKWHLNLGDSNGEDVTHQDYNYDDDETDTPWRG